MESWYLFSAWLLAAPMNAMLTWWAVSLALLDHQTLGNEIINRETLLNSVLVFVAILVWLIRVLMIGIFTLAGLRIFSKDESESNQLQNRKRSRSASAQAEFRSTEPGGKNRPIRPAPKSTVKGF